MILVYVWPDEGCDPAPVGPFPTQYWAERYVSRVGQRYGKTEIKLTMAPVLVGMRGGKLDIVFDPSKDIDVPSEEAK